MCSLLSPVIPTRAIRCSRSLTYISISMRAKKKIDHSECRPSVLPPVLGMQNSPTQIDHDIGGVKELSRPKEHKSVSCVWETPLW